MNAIINEVLSKYNLSISESIDTAQVRIYKVDLANTTFNTISGVKKVRLDLEIALDDESINVYRQGRYIYIEQKKELDIIPFKSIVYKDFYNRPGLLLALGKDFNGNAIITDLSKAPHILVAGSTGSGKSETVHSMLASLISRYSVQPVGISIIDMKGTEFRYCKNADFTLLIDNPHEAFKLLESCCNEMDRRYQELAEIDCADVKEAYEKGYTNDIRFVPQVIIIDELADLILQNKKVEKEIVRIAQKGRAAGMHLIIATQSPRHDVVTGLIKANIPTKIALQTTNAIESRIIIGTNGAEKLYGMGDMFFQKGGSKPIRLQGAYVCDNDKLELKGLIEQRNILLGRPQESSKDSFLKKLLRKVA